MPAMRAAAFLCLTITLTGCGSRRPDPPPEIIRVPQYVPAPAACRKIPALVIPAGASSDDVERLQHEHILELRALLAACFGQPM